MINTPHWWSEIDADREVECKDCKQHEQLKDEAGEFISEIIEQLYSDKTLSIGNLEHALDELCHMFGVRRNLGELQIERTSTKIAWLSDHVAKKQKQF